MKRNQRGIVELLIMAVLAFVAIAALVGVGMWLESTSCHSAWKRSGMNTEWGPLMGCVVEVEPGRWMPADRVREIEIPRKDTK